MEPRMRFRQETMKSCLPHPINANKTRTSPSSSFATDWRPMPIPSCPFHETGLGMDEDPLPSHPHLPG